MNQGIWAAPVAKTAGLLARTIRQTGKSDTKVEKLAHESAAYLERSFRATNAQVNGFLVHNYSQINECFLSQREIAHIANELQRHFNFTDVRGIEESSNRTHRYSLKGTLLNAVCVSIVVSSFRGVPHDSNSTVLVIRARSSADNLYNLNTTLTSVAQAVASIRAMPQLSSYISGQIPEKLVGEKAKGMISAALWAVHAKTVEGIESHFMTSVSAYSSKGPMCILTNNRKMNLQVAVHYDEYHQRSNILVGTPIIVDSY